MNLVETALANLPAHIAAHIPLAQGVIPNPLLAQSPYTIIGQAWSVSLEWRFYLLAPFFVWSLLAWRRLPFAIAVAILLCLASRYFSESFLRAKLPLFLIGICSYFAVEDAARRRLWIVAALGASGAALIQDGPVLMIALVIWGATLLSVAAASGTGLNVLAKVLGTRLAVHFGEISYSLYLVHMIPLYCSIYVLTRIGMSGLAFELTAFAMSVLGSYWLARGTYAYIERPGIELGARLTSSHLRTPRAAQGGAE